MLISCERRTLGEAMSDLQQKRRVQQCRERWKAAPESRAFAPLADALRQSGAHEEALALLEEGLVKHPDFQAAMVILGFTLVDAGRLDHGRKILQTVLKMDSENMVALGWLIEDACAHSAWEEALPMLEHMVLIEPETPQWSQALARARMEFAPKGNHSPTSESFATMTLVDIYLAQGYFGKARDALLRMQRQEPDRSDIVDKLTELAGSLADDNVGANPDDTAANQPVEWGTQEGRAAKRAAEKKNFTEWLGRIEADEGASP